MCGFWQDLDTSNRAVTRCDVAREEAIQAAQLVFDAGDDMLRRNAAALEALEVAVLCAAASLAAQAAAAHCEATAQAAAANYYASATSTAEQDRAAVAHSDAQGATARSRAAAARCDVAGATAAYEATNALADSCVVAYGDAEARSSEARAAAARCVLARDDASTALLVAPKATWRFDFGMDGEEFLESAKFHMKARRDARAAALEARKAAVRCAAASHRALSAASVAREAALLCDAAGGNRAVVVAGAAREAADRCIAATAGAVVAEAAASDRAVPRADRAASEARAAAASCDAAFADQAEDADKDFQDKMRGWLMTVATLFVGIAFQAIVNPPDKMNFDSCFPNIPSLLHRIAGKGASSAHWATPAPSPSPAQNLTPPYARSSCVYLGFSTFTMAVALTMLVMLLTMKKGTSRFTFYTIQLMLTSLAFSVASSFVTSTSGNWRVQVTTSLFFGACTISAFTNIIFAGRSARRSARKGRH